jgi:hypothetical protein
LSSLPPDVDDESEEKEKRGECDGEAESNRKSDLRLGPGNLAEGVSSHRGSSTAGESVEMVLFIASDQFSTDDCEADEEKKKEKEEGEEEEDENDGE